MQPPPPPRRPLHDSPSTAARQRCGSADHAWRVSRKLSTVSGRNDLWLCSEAMRWPLPVHSRHVLVCASNPTADVYFIYVCGHGCTAACCWCGWASGHHAREISALPCPAQSQAAPAHTRRRTRSRAAAGPTADCCPASRHRCRPAGHHPCTGRRPTPRRQRTAWIPARTRPSPVRCAFWNPPCVPRPAACPGQTPPAPFQVCSSIPCSRARKPHHREAVVKGEIGGDGVEVDQGANQCAYQRASCFSLHVLFTGLLYSVVRPQEPQRTLREPSRLV